MDEVIEEELKDNECSLNFGCCAEIGKYPKDCVYFVPQKGNLECCKYDPCMDWNCTNPVAQVNVMVRELKSRGVRI